MARVTAGSARGSACSLLRKPTQTSTDASPRKKDHFLKILIAKTSLSEDSLKAPSRVHNTSEAVRGLLIVVVAPYPLSPFLDNPLNLVQNPIEKVHFAHRSLDPCSSVHPRSPPIHFRDGWDCSSRADASSDRSHMLDGEWCRFAVVNVGIGPRETASE